MTDQMRIVEATEDGEVRETLMFRPCDRADYCETLTTQAAFAPSDLWCLSVATLAMMSRDVMRHA